MLNYTLCERISGGWREITRWTRPIHTGEVLDETLDEAQYAQRRIAELRLTPFTPIRIEISEDGGAAETGYYIVSDRSTEQRTFA